MTGQLQDHKVALLIAPEGTEQAEFEKPKQAVEAAGGTIEVISVETGRVQAVNHDLEPGDHFTRQGFLRRVGRRLRRAHRARRYSRCRQAAIQSRRRALHPSVLRAGQAGGGDLPRSLDVGGGRGGAGPHPHVVPEPADRRPQRRRHLVDEEVVVDQGLVTSRNPDDLPAFAPSWWKLAEGTHAGQARSA